MGKSIDLGGKIINLYFDRLGLYYESGMCGERNFFSNYNIELESSEKLKIEL